MKEHQKQMLEALRGGTKEMADVLEELDDTLDAYDMPQEMGVMISKVKAVWKKYMPVIGTVRKSWIGTMKANETLKVKGEVVTIASNRLMDAVVGLKGGYAVDSYKMAYVAVRPQVSRGVLKKEERDALRKVFKKGRKEGVVVEELEHNFLMQRPVYAEGTKRKRDAAGQIEKVLIPELLSTVPNGYKEDGELQGQLKAMIEELLDAMEVKMEQAGLGYVGYAEVESVLVGTMMQRAILSQKNFGQGV